MGASDGKGQDGGTAYTAVVHVRRRLAAAFVFAPPEILCRWLRHRVAALLPTIPATCAAADARRPEHSERWRTTATSPSTHKSTDELNTRLTPVRSVRRSYILHCTVRRAHRPPGLKKGYWFDTKTLFSLPHRSEKSWNVLNSPRLVASHGVVPPSPCNSCWLSQSHTHRHKHSLSFITCIHKIGASCGYSFINWMGHYLAI